MFKNKKTFIIVSLVAIIIVVGFGVWVGAEIAGNRTVDPAAPSAYTVVYMMSGDIYFGKLHWFPKPYLTDALYVVKSTGQNGETQVGLSSFKSVSWSPVGEIYFNPSQVLFEAPIRNDSQIVSAIQNPAAAAGGNAQAQQAAPSAAAPTMTAPTSAPSSSVPTPAPKK